MKTHALDQFAAEKFPLSPLFFVKPGRFTAYRAFSPSPSGGRLGWGPATHPQAPRNFPSAGAKNLSPFGAAACAHPFVIPIAKAGLPIQPIHRHPRTRRSFAVRGHFEHNAAQNLLARGQRNAGAAAAGARRLRRHFGTT